MFLPFVSVMALELSIKTESMREIMVEESLMDQQSRIEVNAENQISE